MATIRILVTTEVPDGPNADADAQSIVEQLRTHLGGAELVVGELQQAPSGPTHDNYGNPYNPGLRSSPTHDAYGNPYNKGDAAGAPTHDKYGNPYERGKK